MHSPGFTTGKKKKFIPWGALVQDPSSFISEECTPEGFEWKDPSKIQRGEVFRLLYHWRSRLDDGLSPLIWVPTSRLFEDMDEPYAHTRKIRHSKAHQAYDSEDESFDFPSSGDFDQEDDADHDKSGGDDTNMSDHDAAMDGGGLKDFERDTDSVSINNEYNDLGHSVPVYGEPDDMQMAPPSIDGSSGK
jgi:hypothetical protein